MANKTKTEKRKGGQIDKELYIQIGLIVILVLVIGFNLGKVSSGTSGGIGTVSASEIIPTGIPAIYGNDMEVSYNDVSASNPKLADTTIRKLAQYEDMELSSEEMARYITIAGSISCEYCCGANLIIFNNGERACGCAHSFAMRGLAKYLLRNHPDMTNDAILSELGKWKVLFFPDIHEQKAQALEANGIDSTNYINLASNLYRGIEQGQTSGGSMVGGC